MVRFAFHQIVLANSIQNLPFILRLTEPFDRILRNHFRTPISGTTRLARRAAVHQYGSIGEMDSAPPPASRASWDVDVNELPMDVNSAFSLYGRRAVYPHTRRPYSGHGAHTVGGGFGR